jgi:hypothetical protein
VLGRTLANVWQKKPLAHVLLPPGSHMGVVVNVCGHDGLHAAVDTPAVSSVKQHVCPGQSDGRAHVSDVL